jgi:hypothetical protein
MTVEEITGVPFPDLNAPKDAAAFSCVLDAIGECCARHLKDVGYFTEGESESALNAYQSGLSFCCEPGNPSADFIAFAAEIQAERQGKSAVLEVGRMQKLLRWCLGDRIRCWSFGILPGAADGLYQIADSTRVACGYLGCPSMLGGELSIVHVTSVNPVAALVACAWIKQELAGQGDGDAPFIFPLMTDLPTWQTMLQRHFGAV